MNLLKNFQDLKSQYYTIQIIPEGSSHVRTIRIAHLYLKMILWLLSIIGIFALIGFWKLSEINAMILTSKYLKITNEKLLQRHSEYEAAFQELDSLYAMERQIQNILQTYYSNDSGAVASILDQNRMARISAEQTRLDITKIQEYVSEEKSQFDNAPNIIPIIGSLERRFNPAEGSNGVLFATKKQEPVFATANGKVHSVEDEGDLGLTIRITHADHFTTVYGYLAKSFVNEGRYVRKGETIGQAGINNQTGKAALEYQIFHSDLAIDPEVQFNRE